jgi:hypothetical protein
MTSIHESCPPVGSGVEGLYGSPSHRGPQDRSAARPVRRADTIEQGFFIDEAEGSVIDKVADERRTQDDFHPSPCIARRLSGRRLPGLRG